MFTIRHCYTFYDFVLQYPAIYPGDQAMPDPRTINIRYLRFKLASLEELLADTGELTVTRNGKPVARLSSLSPKRPFPSNAALRASMPLQATPSEALVREDRDDR